MLRAVPRLASSPTGSSTSQTPTPRRSCCSHPCRRLPTPPGPPRQCLPDISSLLVPAQHSTQGFCTVKQRKEWGFLSVPASCLTHAPIRGGSRQRKSAGGKVTDMPPPGGAQDSMPRDRKAAAPVGSEVHYFSRVAWETAETRYPSSWLDDEQHRAGGDGLAVLRDNLDHSARDLWAKGYAGGIAEAGMGALDG